MQSFNPFNVFLFLINMFLIFRAKTIRNTKYYIIEAIDPINFINI